ncbi:RSP_7527 family protein [Psychromarinibacter sp. S121]|uniref:RSP_7527 family protein n=1 Tax=Psychromarinibacter sp. S121 TaxID=3415127 RepID=UPI003C7DABC0
MSKYDDQGRIDFVEIEREARRMQAEAMASGFRQMGSWIRGGFKRNERGTI